MIQNILVAGGAGFIGSHMCKHLVQQNNINVLCIDNLYTGSIKNIQNLFSYSNFTFIHHNINEPFTSKGKIHQIYNFACPASPIHYQKNPIFTSKVNFIGTLNLLELAKTHNAAFLQASTSEIYGNPLQHPQCESYHGNVNPIGPRACYDEGKRIAETLCTDFHKYYGVNTKIARIFNTYGPNMRSDDGRVISNFIVQALTQKKLTIYGNGLQTRSFCYIDDLIIGLFLLMNSSLNTPVNLGNPEEITIKELALKIIKLTHSNVQVVEFNLPIDDPLQRKPDISFAQNTLKWSPTICLHQGLLNTISYFDIELKSTHLL